MDSTSETMSSAQEHNCSDMTTKVNDPIKDIAEKEDVSNNLNPSVNQKVEFDEDELLAEQERLKERPCEEDRDLSSVVLSSASASHPTMMEDEDEDELEHILHWVNEPLLENDLDVSLFAEDGTEDRVLSSPVLSSSSPSDPAELEDDEDEDELEYIERWVSECLLRKSREK